MANSLYDVFADILSVITEALGRFIPKKEIETRDIEDEIRKETYRSRYQADPYLKSAKMPEATLGDSFASLLAQQEKEGAHGGTFKGYVEPDDAKGSTNASKTAEHRASGREALSDKLDKMADAELNPAEPYIPGADMPGR